MIVSRKMAEEAALVFGFDISSGLLRADDVRAAYKTEAKKVHPDMGGSAEAFAAVDRAKHVLLHWLERQEATKPEEVPHGGANPCGRCEGRGYVMLRRGFRELRTQCPSCRGAGELYDREEEGDKF